MGLGIDRTRRLWQGDSGFTPLPGIGGGVESIFERFYMLSSTLRARGAAARTNSVRWWHLPLPVRRWINQALVRTGYQVVKTAAYEPGYFTRPDPVLELDDRAIAARISPTRKHLWHVAAPKSGSTWLSAMLTELMGWQVLSVATGYERCEQEVDRRRLLRYPTVNLFSMQQHCRASDTTLRFVEECRVRPVIQTRDIFDSLVSFRDHLVKNQSMPMAFVEESFAELPKERQYDFVIDLVLPWYLNFYASWFRAERDRPGRFLFVDFRDLVVNPEAELDRILEFVGEQRSPAQVRRALESAANRDTKFNQGTDGRGRRLLSPAQQLRIRERAAHYPQLDFSRIGL